MNPSRNKRGVLFWASVVLGMVVVLIVTALLTVGMVLGLMHGDSHALLCLADLQKDRRLRA